MFTPLLSSDEHMADTFEIIKRGTPVLHEKAKAVKDFASLPKLVETMRMAMQEHLGIGIAAPQVGQPLRLFLVAKDLFPEAVQQKLISDVFVNPKLVKKSFKREAAEEGCLSVPQVFGDVTRFARVTVAAQDAEGKKFRISANGLLARVLQHELDHLDGTLFVDKAKPETLHEVLPDGTVKAWKLA